jgi:hypothetical protein
LNWRRAGRGEGEQPVRRGPAHHRPPAIQRCSLQEQSLAHQADADVAATLGRSLFTSFTTTLFWFAVALNSGVNVGAWSSITIAPTLLPGLARC